MFGMQKKLKFEEELRKSLPEGFELPNEVWTLIQWLEDKKQVFQYRNTNSLFMPTMPVESIDHIWSHLAFVIEPELVRRWFGKSGLEDFLVPLVKCGADGSHFAVWRNAEDATFVFLGSEGEAFKVTNSASEFIVLITMGYFSLENRHALASTPSNNYAEYFDGRWPDPVDVKQHVQSTLGVTYPASAGNLISGNGDDQFVKWVEQVLKHP
ncbi:MULTISPECIES: hypothetical protein [unclassified Yoonia]|uniref:hypothetical protein n=1 Tax=unclassified Yoonia TaxID=2629118 RepID=UPI002AFF0244|nr:MULTISPECIES: hypothetical protein [unclassified Yoonia]